jgi:hypothetical protein
MVYQSLSLEWTRFQENTIWPFQRTASSLKFGKGASGLVKIAFSRILCSQKTYRANKLMKNQSILERGNFAREFGEECVMFKSSPGS